MVQIIAVIKNYLGLEQTNSLQKDESTGQEMEKQRVRKIKGPHRAIGSEAQSHP